MLTIAVILFCSIYILHLFIQVETHFPTPLEEVRKIIIEQMKIANFVAGACIRTVVVAECFSASISLHGIMLVLYLVLLYFL